MNNEKALMIPPQVRYVIDRLEAAGHHAYCVGGCVRDHLMGREPLDYDVTTSALPEEMLAVFSGDRVVETGLKHGTLTIVKDGMNIETTTYRIDGTYDDGRHPDEVTYTDKLTDDLYRRDFTINAMAYSPVYGIVDLFHGRQDLVSRVIRCVGEAKERFSEDGLRILRALRFAAVLDFELDDECAAGVRSEMPLLSKISRERIYAELTKLLDGRAAGRVLGEYPDVIAYILPALDEAAVRAAAESIDESHTAAPTDGAMRYALLFQSLDDGDAEKMLASLKPSKAFAKQTLSLLRTRAEAIPETEADLLRQMNRYGDDFPMRAALYARLCGRITEEKAAENTRTAEALIRADRCRRLSDLALTGGDLMAAGLHGTDIGAALGRALDGVMDGKVPNERAALIGYLSSEKGDS